jgi:hypothetical protein
MHATFKKKIFFIMLNENFYLMYRLCYENNMQIVITLDCTIYNVLKIDDV